MGINQHFAQVSNYFIYGAIAVYALAMIAYAAEWAIGGRQTMTRAAGIQADQAKQHAVVAETRRTEAKAAVGGDETGGLAVLTRLDDDGLDSDLDADDEDVLEDPTSPMAAGDLRAETVGRMAVSLTVLAFALQFAGVLCRGIATHRAPWGNLYEFTTAGTLVAMGTYLGLVAKQKARWLGLFVVTTVLVLLGLAVTVLYVDAEQLVPSLQSYWLVIHVTAAVICSGGFLIGSLATALFLVKDAYERDNRLGRFANMLDRMPTAARLDRTAYRVYAFTFPIWTFTIIAGAIWAENAWGRYWGWDPTETVAFITWVVYAAYLHARVTHGWKGRGAGFIGLVGFGCFLFNTFGVSIFINGLHSYAGI